jgi:hypothetical protein
MRFEVIVVMKIYVVIFRVMTQCGLISGYQRFGATYTLKIRAV